MKMKQRKFLTLVISVILVMSTLLAACGSSDDSSSGDSSSSSSESGGTTTVTFWTLTTRQDAVDPIVEAFNEANDDIEVIASFYDTDGIKDACKVAASSGSLPNMWFNWGGSLASFYVENGVTYDLTEYAEENGWADYFTSSSLDLCTFDGQLSGYPTSYNVVNMYYRTDIFEEYGLEVPTTFEEFEQICETLKENGITPISTAGLNGWHVMRFVELLIEYYAGEDLHDQMNSFEASWDNEYVVQALTKYQEFCDKGYFPDGFVTANPDDTKMALMTGTAAMDIQGQWYDGQIIGDGGDISQYATFPFPTGTGRMSAFAEMTQFNAENTDEELEACMKFMDYYYSQENVDEYTDAYNLPLPIQSAEMPEDQPNVEPMITASNTYGTFTITDQAFPTEIADGLFDVQDAIANGQMTTEEGAVAIQDAIDSYYDE